MVGAFLAIGRVASGTSLSVSGPPTLLVRSEPERIVLAWSGPIEAPMQAKIAEALERFEDDPRKIVLSLHSPGGLVQHGHQVIKTIRRASHKRAIETLVESGKICASMCVPIYLVGAERTAHPTARFMFHEVRIKRTAESDRALRDLMCRRSSGRLRNISPTSYLTKISDRAPSTDAGLRKCAAKFMVATLGSRHSNSSKMTRVWSSPS
jgi:hypothetical protein